MNHYKTAEMPFFYISSSIQVIKTIPALFFLFQSSYNKICGFWNRR
ncbi:UNVERIFIED_CONTAM: hypothetical protein ABID98_003466 [Brevibacillus sp. OAP136]